MRRRLFVVLAALVVGLFALDIGLSIFVLPKYWRPLPPFGATTNDRQRAWVERMRAELDEGVEPVGIGRFDPTLGWAYRAGSRNHDGSVTISSQGLRGLRDVAASPPAGKRRVVTFGDSFTFGDEVLDEATWEVQLERVGTELEVLNLGVGGYGTDQALLRAELELETWNADVALLGLLLENIGRNVNRYRPLWYPKADTAVAKPRFILIDEQLTLLPSPFTDRRQLVEAVVDGSVLGLLADHEWWSDSHVPDWLEWSSVARFYGARGVYQDRSLAVLWRDVEGEPFRVTLALLERFCAMARRRGVDFAGILIFPAREDLRSIQSGEGPYWSTLLDELGRRGIPHLDLSAGLLEAQKGGQGSASTLYLRSHLSPAGNGIVAHCISSWIDEHLDAQ